MRGAAYNILEVLLPRRCGVCGCKLYTGEECLCTTCISTMPLTYFWQRRFNPMADKYNARIEALRGTCGDFAPEPYNGAAALYFYKGDYRELSKALKYQARVKLGRYVAAALGRKLSGSEGFRDADIIVPVPLHRLRRMMRGYNQAEIIAREVALQLNGCAAAEEAGAEASAKGCDAAAKGCAAAGGCRVDTHLLKRSRYTRSQAHLDTDKKAENVRGAFRCDMAALAPECPPRKILLIDDVFTTGSTLAECHRAIRLALRERYGAEKAAKIEICAATLAFVGE